ncbi:MAG: (Fe-S)-binding protein, partial [Chloroflexi bacterium]|nr:(Fe-S)-binding protein [Chloroflexota bacterium]
EAIEAIKESGGQTFKLCYQCGMCDTVCPWNRVGKFSMRRLVRQASFGVPEIGGQDIWRCTTCGMCSQKCPRGVETIDVIVSLRRIAAGAGVSPASVHVVEASLAAEGNPLGAPRAKRADWANGLEVKEFTEGTEVLYFPCCYSSYDPRLKRVASATAKILSAAGVDFGILGSKENCCGESIRRAGHEKLFKSLARENIKAFISVGVKKIVVSSPHCYHTFVNEYPEFKVNFDVVHITQYLLELIEKGRLPVGKGPMKRVAYHDPCYLGRHNRVFEEPRHVLKDALGLEIVDMADSRESSLCCGGGGGGIWMDVPRGERFSDLRVKQAIDAGVEVLVTACPYCIINLEYSSSTAFNGAIGVKDITEVVQEVLQAAPNAEQVQVPVKERLVGSSSP